MSEKLTCPECGSKKVTLAHVQTFMANTLEHYCHSVKVQDAESRSTCLKCGWIGCRAQLVITEKRNDNTN